MGRDRGQSYRFLNLALAHGFSLAITVYLAYLGGSWLDRRFGTSPLFLAVLVLLTVAASLHLMVKDVLAETGRDGRSGRQPGQDRGREG